MKPRNIYVKPGDLMEVYDRGEYNYYGKQWLFCVNVDADGTPAFNVNLDAAKNLGYRIHIVE